MRNLIKISAITLLLLLNVSAASAAITDGIDIGGIERPSTEHDDNTLGASSGSSSGAKFAEGSAEACRDELRQWNDECKTATTRQEINRCNVGKVCSQNSSGEWRLSDAGTPYSSEFFNVLDPEQGLVAPDQKTGSDSRFTDATGNRGLIGILYVVINFLAQMVSVLALVVMIVGIFFLITANGDDNQITKGKDALKYSIIGIVFVLLSYTIVLFVQSVFY